MQIVAHTTILHYIAQYPFFSEKLHQTIDCIASSMGGNLLLGIDCVNTTRHALAGNF